MDPMISKELKAASENLHAKMLVHQKLERQMQALKTQFIGAKSEQEKNSIKPMLIAKHNQLKKAEAAMNAADEEFHNLLATEPSEDVYDLLDHKIQESIVKRQVRKLVRESILLESGYANKKVTVDGIKYVVSSGVTGPDFFIGFVPASDKDLDKAYTKGKMKVVKELEDYLKKSLKKLGENFVFAPSSDQPGHVFTVKSANLGEYILEMLK
jgi:hypothetical protein